jgi:hypothetical protein
MKGPPPPGSPVAKRIGCTCSALINQGGAGVPIKGADGKPVPLGLGESRQYWVNGSCPLHGVELREAVRRQRVLQGRV